MEVKGFGLITGDFFIAQHKNIAIGLIVFLPFQKPEVIIG
jgi:hypothetical protein